MGYSGSPGYPNGYDSIYNSSYYPSGVSVSQYPSQVQVSDYSNVRTSTYNGGRADPSSFYTRVANGNPYSEWPNSSNLSSGYRQEEVPRTYQSNPMEGGIPASGHFSAGNSQALYRSEGVFDQHPAFRGSGPKYFIVDTIQENGGERNLKTPLAKDPSQTVPLRPLAPKSVAHPYEGYFRAPSSNTKAPLGSSSPESRTSSVYTNDTGHATLNGHS